MDPQGFLVPTRVPWVFGVQGTWLAPSYQLLPLTLEDPMFPRLVNPKP